MRKPGLVLQPPWPAIEMSILAANASKRGATGEIAIRIAQGVRPAGHHAQARPAREAGDVALSEGFVIGDERSWA